MIFRFSLQHDIAGTQSISEPIGWQGSKLKLTRDPDYHSLVEEFDIEATFYGNNGRKNGGIDFIKQIEQEYGVDAELRLIVEMSFDDGITYPLSFTGLLSMDEAEENPNNQITIPVIPDDLWTKFFTRKDTPVDIQGSSSLDNEPINVLDSINVRLTPQKVEQRFSGYLDEGEIIFEDPATNTYANYYVQLDFPFRDLDEINERYSIPIDVNAQLPVWIFEFEYAGEYIFDVRLEVSRAILATESTNDMDNGSGGYYIKFYFQKNSETPIEFDITNIPLESTVYAFSESVTMQRNDIVRIYGLFGPDDLSILESLFIWGSDNHNVETTPGDFFDLGNVPSGMEIPSYLNVLATTIFPQSNAFSFLLHDVAGQILDRITNDEDIFYSEYLGSIQTRYRQYSDDGCAWNYALVKGLQLRQYSLIEKPFFLSFNQFWNGANPIFNLGLGLEFLDILNLPDLDTWLTTTGADEEWIVGISEPTVTLPGTGPFTPASSEILYVDFAFAEGETYTIIIAYTVFYNSGSDNPRAIRLRIYNDGFIQQFEEAAAFPITPGGSDTVSITFTANSQSTKIGIVFTAGSNVDITITGVAGTWTGQDPNQQVIRIEEKAHFYDSSSTSVYFSNVRDIIRSYDKDVIFNKITTGYKKWQSEDSSGIDDPQTKHEYATRAKIVGRPIDLTSEFIAASLAIETTRRTTRKKSADYKFDNDTFIIALNPSQVNVSPDTSPEVEDYTPELDENFTSVTNLLNADTRYNLILTPLRNLFRWANYLTGWLQEQYLSSSLKFVSGEGNYDMTSDYDCTSGNECVAVICDNVSEKQDVSLASYYIPFGYLHLHYLYNLTIDMTFEEYIAIRDNRNLAIGISLTESNHVKFFIKTLEYTITEGTCKISAWPVTYLDLQVIEQEFQMLCTPSVDDCENAITDELGDVLTDELGRCITFA